MSAEGSMRPGGWIVLWAALGCTFTLALPWLGQAAMVQDVPFDAVLIAGPLLQTLGVFAMQHEGVARGWSVIAGYAAAAALAVAWIGALIGTNAGMGGLFYAFVIVLPATVIALVLQIGTMIAFATRRSV